MMETRRVVTSFLEHGGKVLLLRRSQRVGTYRGRWAGVSGYLEEEDPLRQALREIEEETGLKPHQVRLVARGEPLEVIDGQIRWIVHPFRFEVLEPEAIRLDWEHHEMRWVDPGELSAYPTVPQLRETLERVWRS